MREIILFISEDLGFCDIFSKENPGFESFDELVTRRLSIHNSEDKVLESIIGSRIRSVLCFNADELPESFVGILFSNFKLLKILDFEDAPLHYLPGEVGDLFHLRYLSLRDTKTKIHEGFGRLEALQKLYFVEANHGPSSFEELRKLRQLRKLGIKKLKSEDGRALCTVIEKMNHLESLDVYSITNDEILDLQHIAFPPQFLRRLYLKGRLEKLPVWISKLENLVKIHLRWSRLTEDPLKLLQALPSLLDLGLIGGYDGEVLHFKEGGFQKLKVLELQYLNALNTVIIDNGALTNLQELEIGRTPQLKEVPSGIQHLRKLTNLTFYDVTDEFESTMLPDKGQDYKVVEHVPTVLFRFKRGPGQFDTYAL
ncbi:disease resistance protein RPM1-like [Actinidia eriantha]|uniref:disease resistance protein RPM1-like n=1 Tax=Actinidia eriantha TaxID=165200 RepID=UPI002590A649|nr:disease resistance protein RPM1-like [Actinidia eriantha]